MWYNYIFFYFSTAYDKLSLSAFIPCFRYYVMFQFWKGKFVLKRYVSEFSSVVFGTQLCFRSKCAIGGVKSFSNFLSMTCGINYDKQYRDMISYSKFCKEYRLDYRVTRKSV